jgi:putative endonuclease
VTRAAHLALGAWAEAEAAAYLERHGLETLTRNFRCRLGEIDLVMRDREVLVFVEVRCRAASRFGDALDSVTRTKQRKLMAAARAYLARYRLGEASCRFDVVSVTKRNYGPDFVWLRNAFDQD